MIPFIFMLFFSGLLVCLALFTLFTRAEAEQIDLDVLRERNLYALHILRIMESPDYKEFSEHKRKGHDDLVLSYARSLRKDILELRQLPLGPTSYLYFVLFSLFYGLLRLKNKVNSGAEYLRVLLVYRFIDTFTYSGRQISSIGVRQVLR